MAWYIAIDGGTSNTRIYLASGDKVVDCIKFCGGVRFNTDGNDEYKNNIKKYIDTLLLKNGIKSENIDKILCSGMITSELGLCYVPHIPAPCGIEQLHSATVTKIIPEISNIPFVFIPGVKIRGKDNFWNSDMMRGEETEFVGIMMPHFGDCMYVLPGSHSKHIRTDSSGYITHFTTEMTGEMIYALANDTILKNSFNLSFNDFNREYICIGYECADKVGINAAMFKSRILANMFTCNPICTYSFFIGAVMNAEICSLIKSDVSKIIIGGKPQLSRPMAYLLGKYSDKEIVCLSDDVTKTAAVRGMIRIYEYSGNLHHEVCL